MPFDKVTARMQKPPLNAGTRLSRRDFLRSILLGSATLAGGGVALDLCAHESTTALTLEQLRVPIAGLPPLFNGYRIGFLSDIHLGIWLPSDWVTRALELLRAARIDLLALGGDYVLVTDNPVWRALGMIRNELFADGSPRLVTQRIFQELSTLLDGFTAPDGGVAVAGNHDHWNSTAGLLTCFERCPEITLLRNQERVVQRENQRLRIFGVDDFLTGLPSLPPAWEHRPGQEARIILSHNPDYISALQSHYPDQHFDLALCGHTHGGQIRLPGIGAVLSQVQDRRFISGMVQIPAGAVYTSRGLGVVGLPIRIHCPPEVTVITLEPA
jgi:predicted MPP superfamily phosphohydrolase